MKKRKLHLFLTIVSIILSLITVVGFCVGFSNSQKTTETLNRYDYELGAYNYGTSEFELTKKSLITKDYIDVSGIKRDDFKVEVSEDAECTVSIFYFSQVNSCIGMSSVGVGESQNFRDDYGEATLIKIVINPLLVDGEVPEINTFNKGKFVNAVTVTVAK